jgi:signal transduction histidine kinase
MKRVSILRYWTSRYFIALVIGLGIIAIVSALWIRHSTIENRLDLMTYIAEDTAERVLSQQTDTPPDKALGRPEQPLRNMSAITYILNAERIVISTNQPPMARVVDLSSLSKTKEIQQFTDEISYYAVQKPLIYEDETVGYVVVIDTKENITKVEQKYGQLAFVIIALAFFGWCAIYFLSKRLSRPINDVSKAALEIQHGNYDVSLPSEIKEQEVYELVSSFKEMAQKLEQLEQTRTELLAGVTHELKTPVTSISGLLQAVKDGVVKNHEATEFINMALLETTKMKTLVGDLLAFNSYSVDAIPLNLTTSSIHKIVTRNIQLWQTIPENEKVKIEIALLEKDELVEIDEVRIQQIFTNILNNAMQSMKENPFILIKIGKINDYLTITFSDHGTGIPKEEQPFIFERFYRGENKKYSTRGLGLGLPLSKMMAKSLSGDLQLIKSDEHGSSFELSLPIKKQQ